MAAMGTALGKGRAAPACARLGNTTTRTTTTGVWQTKVLVADPTMFGSGARSSSSENQTLRSFHARNLSEAVEVAQRELPDVVLLDLDLPPMRAVAAIEPLTAACSASIVVWSLTPASTT